MNRTYASTALVTIRIVLGLLFLVSGTGKLINGADARYLVELLATEFYWLIEYAGPIVITASIVELVLAVFLLWGKYLGWSLFGTLAMLLGFSAVLGYFYFQGMAVENCGCFGAFGLASGLEFTLIRNIVLILMTTGAFMLKSKLSAAQIPETV